MRRSLLLSLILVLGTVNFPVHEQEKTPDRELTQYIHDAQKAGLEDAQIQQSAVKAGWTEHAAH
jgi:hypothetical protein